MPAAKRNARTRPVFKISASDDQEKFKPVPAATGAYPFRLDIKKILPEIPEDQIVFHVAGDTGGTRSPQHQQRVAGEMIRQCQELNAEGARPQFLFHLGDIVYNFGQASEYYRQFFNPFWDYPAPIFAIAGNHDADIDLADPNPAKSLDAFVTVFCNTETRVLKLSKDASRKANIQPNVYWVLETPLADIIGLYSNVPKFGNVQNDQRQWFIEALKTSAASRKAIIVCIHHAPFSADVNHGSSIHMQAIIDGAIRESKVFPDLVLSGHVHNYQRFNKRYPGGRLIPFIVAGNGGYADLHPLADPQDKDFPDDSCLFDDVELQNYCDDAHGFLKISLARNEDKLTLSGAFYATDNKDKARLYDSFKVDIDR
jgi:acid phosphatase type 7